MTKRTNDACESVIPVKMGTPQIKAPHNIPTTSKILDIISLLQPLIGLTEYIFFETSDRTSIFDYTHI